MTNRLLKFLITAMLAVLTIGPSVATWAQQSAPKPAEQPKAQIVYVTRTGKKYHRDGCRYLAMSKFPISLKDAKGRGYTPCKVCRPPQ